MSWIRRRGDLMLLGGAVSISLPFPLSLGRSEVLDFLGGMGSLKTTPFSLGAGGISASVGIGVSSGCVCGSLARIFCFLFTVSLLAAGLVTYEVY